MRKKAVFLTVLGVALAAAVLAYATHGPADRDDGAGEAGKAAHDEGSPGHHEKGAAPHWAAPEEAVKRPNPTAPGEPSVARGRRIFAELCVSCHGKDLRGKGRLAADLERRPADLLVMAPRHSDGELAWKIAEGRGPMPGWKDSLSGAEIWDVVNYVKSAAQRAAAAKRDDGGADDHRHDAEPGHHEKKEHGQTHKH